MKTVVILQPGYIPWLGFFDQMKKADVFVYYDDVPYDKNGWRNRNRIKSNSGAQWLTVPILTKGRFGQLINETEIDQKTPWAKKHLTTIKQCYAKSPFLKNYLPELESFLFQDWKYLVDLDISFVELICQWLDIETETVCSSTLNIKGEKSERLLKICQHFDATQYLSGVAAKSYLDTEMFDKNKIKVVWQQFQHPIYAQLHGGFEPYLSILDLIFNEGIQSRKWITGY